MARATIDFGIDLGTTNSEIALMNRGSMRVFKAWDNRENTPSVVRILSDGTIQVGKNAYDRLVDDEENTVAEFKRLMGRSHTYHFADSGRTLTPEELSSEVLKILKADVVLAGFDCTAAAFHPLRRFQTARRIKWPKMMQRVSPWVGLTWPC